MTARRWVILGVGVAATAGLVLAAVVFGLQGVEVASWIAAVAGVVVGVAALVVALPSRSTGEKAGRVDGVPGARSIRAEQISGIASTGDDAVNVQQR